MSAAEAAADGAGDKGSTSQSPWRDYAVAIAVSSMTVTVACMQGVAFMLSLEVPVVALWLVYDVIGAWVRPARRPRFVRKLALGAATIALVCGAQAWLDHAARRDAEAAVAAVEAYRVAHGSYPASLDAVGITRPARKRWGIMYWHEATDASYALSYASVFCAFDRWDYEPGSRAWTFRPD